MNRVIKKIVGVIIFLCIVFVPAVLILVFTPDGEFTFDMLVYYFGIVIFSIWGYMIITMRNMSKELKDAVESMKMQNAAIAYKLTNDVYESEKDKKGKDSKDSKDKKKDEEKIDIMKVNLNPEEPLIPDKNKNKKNNKSNNKAKKIDDNYDDFK